MGLAFMPGRTRSGPHPPFDAPGFALLVLALVALLTGLSSGQGEGWGSNAVVIELSVALLAAAGFVLWELSTPAPMLNPRLFAVRDFGAAALVAVVYGAGIFGSTYLIPLFVQTIQGYTPTRAGLLLMPAGLAMLVVFPIAGRLADRLPAALPTATGLLIFSVSCWLQTGIGTDIPFWTLALWLVLGRVGLGLSMTSMNAGALSALPAHWVGQGSGAINFARQFGGAIGVNLSLIWLERQTQLHAQALVATQDGHLGATREMLRELERLLGEGGVAEALRLALAQEHLSQALLAQASLLAFRDTLIGMALACLLEVLPALLLTGRRGRR
jgi:EmrB/QacA subfamily drug resistance transporter